MSEQSLFLAALDRDPIDRDAFLTEACAGDAELRAGVETLLKLHSAASGFLEVSAVEQLSGARTEHAAPDLSFLAASSEPGSLGRLDHYEIVEVIGCGGTGVVLRARDTKLERIVAIKVLISPLAASRSARQRFAREARATAAIRDEHVVAIHAVHDDGPVPYLVMEFVNGSNLESLLRTGGRLEINQVLRIGAQVAQGLAAAHRQGLIHRDIKPANILLENGVQRVKLTDFGLARAADDASVTQQGLIAGTPLYMAPEQASGAAIDARTDLFSLGSVLYEMCTGLPAFRAPTTVAVIRKVCDEEPRPIREVNPDVPEVLRVLIDRLHAKQAADRPASAQEVANMMTAMLAGTAGGGFTLSAANAKRKSRQARPKSSAVWAAAAIVLLCVGLGLTEATQVTHLSATVIRLFFPEGTLVVDVDDPSVSVTVDDSDLVITGAGAKEIRLKPGQYKVEASKDGKVVRRELVNVARNGRQVVRISKESEGSPTVAAWEKSVAAMPAEQQVQAIVRRLKELNPGFDGQVTTTTLYAKVTGLKFESDNVADISPLRVLTALESLECSGSGYRNGKLADLSPLRGLPLTRLKINDDPVVDLSPLEGMPLEELCCHRSQVTNLAPVRGMKLTSLEIFDTGVTDLSPLAGMRLTAMNCTGTPVTDLGPLRGMPMEVLLCGMTRVSDLSALQGMPLKTLTLQHAGITSLAPLKGMPLTFLDITGGHGISDLSALADLPLEYLNLSEHPVSDLTPLASLKDLRRLLIDLTQVSDLSPLRGTGITTLSIKGIPAQDLSPLRGLALENLRLDYRPDRAEFVRSFKELKWINDKPAADFWKEADGK